MPTIKVKYEIPELLEAVCYHPDCPEWLKDAIWEAFNNLGHHANYSASYWRSQFESMSAEPSLTNILDSEVIQ